MEDIIRDILRDIEVELTEKFDRNFSQGGFFGDTWPVKSIDGNPSHLIQTGALRRSIRSSKGSTSITFTSSTPYSEIHNEGGEIAVTAAMKKFFWAMYYKTGNDRYKALALKKVGDKIEIPKRQFLGDSPEVDRIVSAIITDNLDDLCDKLANQMNKK